MKASRFVVLAIAALGIAGVLVFFPNLTSTGQRYVVELISGKPAADAAKKPDAAASNADTATAQPAGSSGKGRSGGGGPIAVVVATAQKQSFPVVTRSFATVQSPAVVTVGARISSQVTEIHVKDGQMVKAGDLLISLDDRALVAQLARDKAILAKDSALLVSTTADMNRAKDLASKQAGTQQAYDDALATQQSAQATVDSDQATVEADQIQLDFTKITAPIDGRLGAVQVSVGDLVGGSSTSSGATSGLVTITQVDPIQVSFHLPESNLQVFKPLLDAGKAPQVRVLKSGSTDLIASGPMDFIDSAVDTASGTITMRATVENASFVLWPGQFVDVEIDQDNLNDATVIPTVALQPGQNGQFVYVVGTNNTVEVRPVKVALSDGDTSAIASGLEPGDKIVTEGQLRLKPGAAVKPTTATAEADDSSAVQPAAYEKSQTTAQDGVQQ